jgi:tetratricopeptide (TPR) repeat protein
MDCPDAVPEELVESYVLGRLDEAASEAFEDHYFGCRTCLVRLATLQALPAALRRRARQAPRRPGSAFPRRWLPAWAGVAAGLAALATAWLGFRLVTERPAERASTPSTLAESPPPVHATAPRLAEWARINPPRFRAPSLRGPNGESPEFRTAMEHYAQSDYVRAMAGLEQAVRLRPGDAAARFFLGACHLLTGRITEGIVRLEETIALGESPYLEEARLYLAKALAREGRLDEAAAQLQKASELRGDLEDEAREGLRRIRESLPRQD